MADKTNYTEEVKEAVTDDQHSLGEHAPGAPFMVVGMTYVVILIVACLSIAAIIYAIR